MNPNKALQNLTKEQLIELLGIYAKNWLAADGVWFQSVEKKFGMEEAMFHDVEIRKKFTVIEAKRIKEFLQLPERLLPEWLQSRNWSDADGLLLRRAQKGDAAAFGHVVERHQRRVYAVALRIVRRHEVADDVEDARIRELAKLDEASDSYEEIKFTDTGADVVSD